MYKSILMTFALLLGTGLYADHWTSSKTLQELQFVISSPLKGADWVRLCIDKYPEILWLADENVRKTEEGKASLQGAYSEQLFEKRFIEFDRTIMTLYCL